jgi:hypothetical protein
MDRKRAKWWLEVAAALAGILSFLLALGEALL